MSNPSGISRRGLLGAGTAAVGAGVSVGASSAAAGPRRRTVDRIGFVLSHEQFPTRELVRYADAAESAGFGKVWASDHFQPWQDNQGHAMFPWNTLSLVAARTRRLTYGTGVTCPTYRHHPSQVAQAFASLGVLSPGRVFLGVGTGEALNELAAVGQFGRYRERAARLVEAVTLIRRLWTGEKVTFDGTYFHTVKARLWDLPTEPVPIYIAASGPNSAYLAGRYGDGWVTGAADFAKPELQQAFRRGARAAGKDPDALPKLVETFVVVGTEAQARYAADLWRFQSLGFTPEFLYDPDPASIRRKAEARLTLEQVYSQWTVGTDPQVHIDAAQKLIDQGATPFIHSGQRDQLRVIDFYGRRVLPALRL